MYTREQKDICKPVGVKETVREPLSKQWYMVAMWERQTDRKRERERGGVQRLLSVSSLIVLTSIIFLRQCLLLNEPGSHWFTYTDRSSVCKFPHLCCFDAVIAGTCCCRHGWLLGGSRRSHPVFILTVPPLPTAVIVNPRCPSDMAKDSCPVHIFKLRLSGDKH